MAELVALRAILHVLFKLTKGQTLTACACGGRERSPLQAAPSSLTTSETGGRLPICPRIHRMSRD